MRSSSGRAFSSRAKSGAVFGVSGAASRSRKALKPSRSSVFVRNVVTKDTGDVVVEGKSSVSSTESETSSERARVSIPWTLSREPIGEGPGGPENLSWNPTNQTIKDWRSIYRNTSLSNQTQKSGDARWIPKACVVDGEIPSDLQGGTLLRNGPGMLDIYGKEKRLTANI